MLPNFLIVGAAKSSTTSLHYYLQGHPEIFLPNEKKELRFFSQMPNNCTGNGDDKTNMSITSSIEEYQDYYESVNNQVAVGESSPDYLYYYEKSIVNIKKYLDNPKIIIILRNPIERAYSHYIMYVRDGREELSFEEALNQESNRKKNNWEWGWQYREVGLYYEQVKAYQDNFVNVEVYLFEDLIQDDIGLIKKICKFIGVDDNYVPSNINEKFNISGVPKSRLLHNLFIEKNILKSFIKPFFDRFFSKKIKSYIVDKVKNNNMSKIPLEKEIKDQLKDYYYEDIIKLQNLIKRDLSKWIE